MDFTYFPFDTHNCQLRFVSRGLRSEIRFVKPEGKGAFTNGYKTNGEWDIGDIFITEPQSYDAYSFSACLVNFEFKVSSINT